MNSNIPLSSSLALRIDEPSEANRTSLLLDSFPSSCNFEGSDWLCGYEQPIVRDIFDWSYSGTSAGNHYMMVNTSTHLPGTTARLITPEIKLQDTHCFTFRAYLQDQLSRTLAKEPGLPAALGPAGQLHVYLLDKEGEAVMQPVWESDHIRRNVWTSVHLALNPRAYQVVFEALIDEATPGMIALDDVIVSPVPCVSTPHFLRLGNKEVNAGWNVTLQCLLWGHSGPNAHVTMQKSTGEILLPKSKELFDNHMSARFTFVNVMKSDSGMYRCLSGNETHIGVSNYASLLVKVPPTPKRGPAVITPGSTHFVIDLNSDSYTGEGPIVQTVLFYRPVHGTWSDVHHITTARYDLWNLQPDTEYELAVTLVRPGPGGAGPPSPKLIKKTKCGLPKSAVQNVNFVQLGSDDPGSVTVQWDAPDFSVTQCHNYAFVVKYRLYVENEDESSHELYQSKRVENSDMVIIRDLQTYTKYWFKVEITNSAGSKETGDYIIQTSEGAPGPVPPSSFVVTSHNETYISLEWGEPLEKHGSLQGYEISYQGDSSFDPNFVPQDDKGLVQVNQDVLSLLLDRLHPGTLYLISIKAETGAGFGEATEITASTDIAAPTIPQYPSSSAPSNAVTTPTTIEITIIPAQSNGAPISNYYVIVEDVTPEPSLSKKKEATKARKVQRKKRNLNHRNVYSLLLRDKREIVEPNEMQACYDPPITYEEAQANNKTVYSPARFNPGDISKETKFVVGGGTGADGLANPALDPDRIYNIYLRVESSVNGETKVKCVLVAKKGRFVPTMFPPLFTTKKFNKPVNSPDDTSFNDPGEEKEDGDSSNPPGVKDKSEQGQVMMYAGIGAAVLGILLIVVIVAFLVIRRRMKGRKDEVVSPFQVTMMMSDVNGHAPTMLPTSQSEDLNGDRQALMPDVVGYEHQDYTEKTSGSGGRNYSSSNDERFAVRVDDFHVHVQQMNASSGYGFRTEFASFPDGNNAPWTVADCSLNRRKNRYGNIMAYDHSRVVLEPSPGHEEAFESDYINASYINGYKTPSMYIATQAPTPDTISDFWWMVWQEKTSVIVMVCNLVENGRRKCEKYWPDERELHGTVEVSLNNEEYMADYVIRTFVLQETEGYDVREVKQFHFTTWPDHGVPSRPTNLLSFVRRIKAYEAQGEGPTVVHCSAGAGRSGCFIVVDMMLDMAREEDMVDIHNTVRDLRSKRVNMVQTEEQYIFIHESVLEALLCGETSVSANTLAQHYDYLITVDSQTTLAPIQEEFDTLNVITPKLLDDECSVALQPRNQACNRFMDVLPADRHLAYLATPNPTDRESNYINAVYIDSYTTKNSFLVTQMPLPNTVLDIWRLIYDHNCSSVVMMNDFSEHDQSCSQYWPDTGTAMFGPFAIELIAKDDEVDVITRLFKLQNVNKPQEFRFVKQFQLTNWPAARPVPFSRNGVLRVTQLVTKWQAECVASSRATCTLVHCVAGAGRSGTFISCFNICEQLRHEYASDVFNIVQRLRNVRPQLVETLEQYRFCYEVGIEFAES